MSLSAKFELFRFMHCWGLMGREREFVEISLRPIHDLPNQEKNRYWTVYWWETWALYAQETDQELLIGPLREIEKTAEHMGMKTNDGSLIEMRNYRVVNNNL